APMAMMVPVVMVVMMVMVMMVLVVMVAPMAVIVRVRMTVVAPTAMIRMVPMVVMAVMAMALIRLVSGIFGVLVVFFMRRFRFKRRIANGMSPVAAVVAEVSDFRGGIAESLGVGHETCRFPPVRVNPLGDADRPESSPKEGRPAAYVARASKVEKSIRS
ncbi:MAG: hypothetical protein ACLFRG_11775, partial [Desulfococcaceae bacterium]